MTSSSKALQEYRRFLESIPLTKYREELKDVKWVEQDLYPELLPLASIFRNYWNEQRFLDFETWFEEFWEELNANHSSATALKNFKKYFFDKDGDGWFKRGFRARMYRTWVSVLTQLDFCYVLKYVCEKQGKSIQLECNAELDARGVDARVGSIDFQVAKISQRKEARAGASRGNKITVPYAVYDLEEYQRRSQSQRVEASNRLKYQKALQAFHKYFISLQNGFVVFSEYYGEQVVSSLDDIEELREKINKISMELSGE